MWKDSVLIVFLEIIVVLVGVVDSQREEPSTSQRCYDSGKAQRCHPEFVNAAFSKRVEASSTCGEWGRSEYCMQNTGQFESFQGPCQFCDPRVHGTEALTDLNNNDDETWWQSGTLYEDVEKVNLTLSLKKSFEITYIQLKFHSPRPESFAIYKRTSEDSEWIPFQYYSLQCRGFYGVLELPYIDGGEETRALCTSEFSDISPLSGGQVTFATLEGRPSKENFDTSKELQDWVTATEIRISLDRHNTFGDELFSDVKVLKSYFFAITDFAVGGTCKCNGHASDCVPTSSLNGEQRLICRCEHNTAGPDCNECKPFYNDKPWARATAQDAHECKACNCNGFSERCFFDQKQYELTGHGGHCSDCRGNRDGQNCEKCRLNYYQQSNGYCIPCDCNEIGSRNLQCNSEGKCQCRPGVGGDKCNQCLPNFYDFGTTGCKSCNCSVAGSLGNEAACDARKGFCHCKENVEGQQCGSCRLGYFNLDVDNEFGCTPCFCFGHAAVCSSASGYNQVLVESTFARNNDKWSAEEGSMQYGYSKIRDPYHLVATQNIELASTGRIPAYFIAPDRFLGDQRGSYNQELNFTLRIGENSARTSVEDVILEGGGGLRVSAQIFSQGNPLPSTQNQEYSFRLHEHQKFGWNPRLTARDFLSLLSNLTAIKIRATYYSPNSERSNYPQLTFERGNYGVGFLDNVKLKTARRGTLGSPATWIESCTCPEGYIGQFCESCAPGYTHEPKGGGPFARCVPCTCNGHADICDAETGQCYCKHDTMGDNCERCAKGFYGNPQDKLGNENDCKPCPCPNQGACIQLQDDNQIVCLECPLGYAGPQCEFCGDGYWGDPMGQSGTKRPCQSCDCNENIDPNAVGNCNRTTGECLKCIYNTYGAQCHLCGPGFYGDALKTQKGDCKPCECDYLGTIPVSVSSSSSSSPPYGGGGGGGVEPYSFVCDSPSGLCPCKANVKGRGCDSCEDGFYNIESGKGCDECECDTVGSLNKTCDIRTGQCFCRDGVVGLRCNECAPNHFGFSTDGCQACDCDPIGALSLQCDPSGQCPCRNNVEGMHCERCKENKHNRQAGCVDCPACYNLVQEAINAQREKLAEMEKLLEDIASTPTVSSDTEFEEKVQRVLERVNQLWDDARSAAGGEDKSLLEKVNELKDKIVALGSTSKQIRDTAQQCDKNARDSSYNLTITENTIKTAQEALKNAQRFVDSDGKDALERAQEKSVQQSSQASAMSEFAREARALAEQHEEEALKLERIGAAALNTSQEAYNILDAAILKQATGSQESRLLIHSILQLEDEVKSTERKANQSLETSKEAYANSLNLYKDALALVLPAVDLAAVKKEAQDESEEAGRLKAELDQLLEERKPLLAESDAEIEKAKVLIEHSELHQQQAEALLADLDKVKADAEKALNQSQNTYTEANRIYNTLQDFNQNVDSSKADAERAKDKIPGIRSWIDEANTKASQNRGALSGAKSTATSARLDAEEAKTKAEMASQEASAVRAECAETRTKSEALLDATRVLSTNVTNAAGKLTEIEDRLQREEGEVKMGLDKASEAKSKSNEAYDKVQKALSTLQEISISLNNLDQINEDGISGLDGKIAEVEKELEDADLDSKLEALRTARNRQAAWIKNYESELDTLRKEVENVQAIRNSLPPDTKCWKISKLEP